MPRRLHLLRHAKSSWSDSALADHDRPLSARGRKACELLAAELAGGGVEPQLVLCSSARRTRETLELIASALGDGYDVSFERAIYEAGAQELIDGLGGVPGETRSVMLIGHQPALGELALSLAGSGEGRRALADKFPTGALASLDLAGGWTELAPGSAELVAFIRPEQLKRASGRAPEG